MNKISSASSGRSSGRERFAEGWALGGRLSRRSSRRSFGPLVLTCLAMLIVGGLPAHGQAPAQTKCLPAQHWDKGMQMCMPGAGTAKTNESDQPSSNPGAATSPTAKPTAAPPASSCPSGRQWDPSMSMCMPGKDSSKAALMFHLNQFMVYSSTSGPRGQSRLTGPGMWMLMYDNDLSSTNHLQIDVMGSPEQLTVGDKGTPQLLQTENIDAMHAHDTIMAFEFRDVVALGGDDKQQLTFLFAPRGEAAIGPVPFMHRESAEGNPDAPLGHGLQDGFHDASTVFGVEYQFARTTFEATGFSGQDISWPVPLHSPDSYGLRVNQGIDDHLSVGASYADALLPNDAGGLEHNRFISAWLTTSHVIDGNTLKSSFIWGQGRAGHDAALNSFLAEAVYQRGKNALYGRAEILQITPAQLAITHGPTDAKWVEALTIGYERTLLEKDDVSLHAGGSYTQDFVPAQFRPEYGSDPRGLKVYLRLKFDDSWTLG